MANKSFFVNEKDEKYIKIANPPMFNIERYIITIIVLLIVLAILIYISNQIFQGLLLTIIVYSLIAVFSFCYLLMILYSQGRLSYYKLFLNNEKKTLNYEYRGKENFLKIVKKNAHEKGYIFSEELKTDYIEEHFIVLAKQQFERIGPTDEKLAFYFANEYHAEYLVNEINKDVRMCYRSIPETKKFLPMFCDNKKNSYPMQVAVNSIVSIIIVVVDKKDKILEDILLKDHMNNVLFCVISLDCPNKIFIGNDLRMNQDEDYIRKIEDLASIIDLALPPKKEFMRMFEPSDVFYKGRNWNMVKKS